MPTSQKCTPPALNTPCLYLWIPTSQGCTPSSLSTLVNTCGHALHRVSFSFIASALASECISFRVTEDISEVKCPATQGTAKLEGGGPGSGWSLCFEPEEG